MQPRLALLALFLVAAVVRSAQAQLVRGVATERTSGQEVPGVLVTLERAGQPGQPVGTALTNELGEYAIRAPEPGRYRVSAKRIGVQRHLSEEFDLAAGETRRIDVALDAVLYTLPEIVVEETGMCVPNPAHTQRVASLWDEVRTALTATQISLRDRLFEAHLARYVRELDPRSLRIMSESRSATQGLLDRPFVSLSGDSLSKAGYWRMFRDGSAVFYGPDAEVLLSEAFRNDHCYGIVEGGRDRRGLIGLTFEPNGRRRVPDLIGTLWIDGKTFELRLVDFRYTRLEDVRGTERVGGEVHFARLANGAWIVRRWYIRMPQFGRAAATPVGVESQQVPSVMVRPTVYRLIEEGGDVFAEGLRMFEDPASLAGLVSDTSGRPFAGVTVRLSGTPFATTSGADGRFRLDSLPGGRFAVVAEHETYAALGAVVAEEVTELEEGATRQITLRATSSADVVRRLCNGKGPQRRRATLRLMLVDSVSGAPLPGLPVSLRWTQYSAASQAGIQGRGFDAQGVTDARGAVAFCELPAANDLELFAHRPGGQAVSITTLRLQENELAARKVSMTRPR